MRDVAILSFTHSDFCAAERTRDEVELIRGAVNRAMHEAGVKHGDIGFTCSGSCDYVQGLPFSFVAAIDALGAWPPIAESHLEMDGAWALFETYNRLQHGDVDVGLVYCFGKPSLGDLSDVMSQQLDPYTLAPLWPDPDSLAGLQARMLLDAGKTNEQELAEIAARSRRDGFARGLHGGEDVQAQAILDAPCHRAPLRPGMVATQSDGAAAMVIAAGDRARALATQSGRKPVWIRGIDHRIDSMQPGLRDLLRCESAEQAARGASAREAQPQVAELHALFAHEEVLLRQALGLDDDVQINPSGGCFGANVPMVAGLTRIGEAASRIWQGDASRAVAHAQSGPLMQQNLVCVLAED